MMLTPEHRDKLREAALRRKYCPRCQSGVPEVVDGARVDGLPGISYRLCHGCGWVRAITKKPKKTKF